MGGKYKKGQTIEHKCWECGNPTMKIYRISGNPHGSIIWCECECGGIDDNGKYLVNAEEFTRWFL